ncbi:hypothetical protein VULLAG_LOCUS17133 [Vulpes lagopus]
MPEPKANGHILLLKKCTYPSKWLPNVLYAGLINYMGKTHLCWQSSLSREAEVRAILKTATTHCCNFSPSHLCSMT